MSDNQIECVKRRDYCKIWFTRYAIVTRTLPRMWHRYSIFTSWHERVAVHCTVDSIQHPFQNVALTMRVSLISRKVELDEKDRAWYVQSRTQTGLGSLGPVRAAAETLPKMLTNSSSSPKMTNWRVSPSKFSWKCWRKCCKIKIEILRKFEILGCENNVEFVEHFPFSLFKHVPYFLSSIFNAQTDTSRSRHVFFHFPFPFSLFHTCPIISFNHFQSTDGPK